MILLFYLKDESLSYTFTLKYSGWYEMLCGIYHNIYLGVEWVGVKMKNLLWKLGKLWKAMSYGYMFKFSIINVKMYLLH